MNISFELISISEDKESLVAFLSSEEWLFHVNSRLTQEKILEMIDEGVFDGSNNESFWILDCVREKIGFIRIFDLEDISDGYPLFDLRIRNKYRGQGVGTAAVQWLTKYLFEKYPQLERIAGTTRADNIAMRKIFISNRYAKEGHYRKDWTAADGKRFDTVKYGILREDWLAGETTPINWSDEP
jgi:RimJ/RimL family protein N-acetyltransferase